MLRAGDILGDGDRYAIERVLGSGSFSTVYLARDGRLGNRFVAIKEFNPTSFPDGDEAWARDTIRHEATLRAQLPSHPLLADVTDYFQANDREYLVMEYVEGTTLRQLWERQPGRRFGEEQVLDSASQLLKALHFLHSHNPPIIYRDLKPENIMVRPDGQLVLIDFGIARFYSHGQHSDTINLGTSGYAAPEQYARRQSDERTDIYALGVLLHQLLSGMDPFEHVFSLPSLAEVRPDIRPETALAIAQAMHSAPDFRFQSARALASALGIPLVGSPPDTSDTIVITPPPRIPKILFVVLAFLVLSGTGFMALKLWRGTDDPQFPEESVGIVQPVTEAVTPDNETLIKEDDAPPTSTPSPTNDFEGEGSTTETGLSGTTFETFDEALSPTNTLPPTETAIATGIPAPPTATATPQRITYQDRPIVFDSTRNGGATNIFIMDWDGRNLRQLTNSSNMEDEADLSPDGQKIAYERQEGNDWYIYVMDVNGNNKRRLTPGREPDWSPDGRYLAYESPSPENIMLYDFNGGGVREIYASPRRDRAPSWAPDGHKIAFMSEINDYWQLFVTDVNSGQTEQITFDPVDKRFPVWSPDGELLAYNSVAGGVFQIWTIRPDGGNPQQLTDGSSNGRPAWSPDGQYIIFNSNRSGAWRIWRIDRDGRNPQQLTPEGAGGGDQRADWGAH